MATRHRFGSFVLDEAAGQLTREGAPRVLQPLTYELLRHFLANPGRLFTRPELTAALWPDTHVTDASLTQVIRRLRRALAPDVLVETVPRRGYRFLGEVQSEVGAPVAASHGLVGRDASLEALAAWHRGASDHAVLTLLGPGGVGKTALARRQPGTFVDLSGAATTQDVLRIVRAALSIEGAGDEPVAEIGWVLAERSPQLMVLDNAEAFVEALAPMLERWLVDAPAVRWLVTSRRVLGLPQEHVMAVPPLAAEHAQALLVARGDVDPDDPHLPRLVAALDGLPLAIELIAPRTRVLPPAELVDRLHGLLRRPSPVRSGRHQSLQSCFDASWSLLSEPLRTGLALLSAPVGPFTVDEAAALLDDDMDGLDVIQGLVDQAWLQVRPDKAGVAMLPTVRRYVEEVGDGEVARRGHVRHGRRWAREGDEGRESAPVERIRRLRDGLDELMVAHERALSRSDRAVVVGTAHGIYAVLRRQGPIATWRPVMERSLEHAEGMERTFFLTRLAIADRQAGAAERAGARIAEALSIAEESGDRLRIAIVRMDRAQHRQKMHDLEGALQDLTFAVDTLEPLGPSHNLGVAFNSSGVVLDLLSRGSDAAAAFRRGLETHRACGSRVGEAQSLENEARLLGARGRSRAALETYAAASELYRGAEDHRGMAACLANLAAQRAMVGDFEAAIRDCRDALERFSESGELRLMLFHLPNLARMQMAVGELEEARATLVRTIALGERLGRPVDRAEAIGTLGLLYAREGRFREAQARLDEALVTFEAHGMLGLTVPYLTERGRIALGRSEIEAAQRDVETAMARATDGLDGYGSVFVFLARAEVDAARGQLDGARASLAEAERRIAQGGWSQSPEMLARLAQARAAVGDAA